MARPEKHAIISVKFFFVFFDISYKEATTVLAHRLARKTVVFVTIQEKILNLTNNAAKEKEQ
jgi:hypothetical protein